MKRTLRRTLACIGFVSILFISICVYAADDDLLTFIPAIIKAQTTVNPVGTWTGPGSGSWGTCSCDLEGLSVVVTAGTRSGMYLVSFQTTGTATCDSGCGMVLNFSNLPARLVGNRLIFASSVFSNMASYTLMTSIDGELVISGSTASLITKTFNFNVPYDENDKHAMSSVAGGTLTKQ
ncbi:hypothetical protein [Desulfovibrio sp. DV]|uniref:hypothetical protein n=1 Tax=Desulfovibrio sp. DV TaxID=1844708 RepID=UPI00111510CF|nr:hypothetical protein [Desulfovibrio sp. DV]